MAAWSLTLCSSKAVLLNNRMVILLPPAALEFFAAMRLVWIECMRDAACGMGAANDLRPPPTEAAARAWLHVTLIVGQIARSLQMNKRG
jgi:hypothetical protein